jgi:superfamily I DNA and/or RNA helicase
VSGGDKKATKNKNVGFLKNIQRLNVALTRAKQALYIVGHRDTLQVDPMIRGTLDG